MSNLSLIYKEIQKEYDLVKSQNQAILLSRINEVYEAVPEIKIIDNEISDLSIENAKRKLFDKDADITEYKNQVKALKSKKNELLEQAGYSSDYLSPIYNCKECQDTGYIAGQKCHCLMSRLIEERYEQSHIKSILQKENFSTFSFDYHTDEEKARISKVLDASHHFIDTFDTEFKNLLFFGEVGTGKTFLSNCIAKDLLDKGKTVLYFTAPGLFDMISSTFRKNSSIDSDSFYEDIFNCDLLILDDLGTESYNSFTVGQFFIILNERLSRRKSTVISTNMDIQKLKDLYSERSISRILGGYDMFRFEGQDLRINKKIKFKA